MNALPHLLFIAGLGACFLLALAQLREAYRQERGE